MQCPGSLIVITPVPVCASIPCPAVPLLITVPWCTPVQSPPPTYDPSPLSAGGVGAAVTSDLTSYLHNNRMPGPGRTGLLLHSSARVKPSLRYRGIKPESKQCQFLPVPKKSQSLNPCKLHGQAWGWVSAERERPHLHHTHASILVRDVRCKM